ncbi:MAG: hypothetical protein MRY21_04025 [Simkaniaceae bacterium]|nr:hypothetical protein [Simkaniaceae bacterium]
MNNEDRIYALELFLGLISNTLNDEYMNRALVNGVWPELGDCVEYVEQIMDTIEIMLDPNNKFEFSEEQIDVIKRYYKIVDDFPHKWEPPQIMLMTPEWQEVQKAGQEVLNAFNYPSKYA